MFSATAAPEAHMGFSGEAVQCPGKGRDAALAQHVGSIT